MARIDLLDTEVHKPSIRFLKKERAVSEAAESKVQGGEGCARHSQVLQLSTAKWA